MIRKIRIVTQGLFLLTFLWLFLQTESKGADELGYPVKIFLDADPLIFITTILSSRAWHQTFFLAILVIIATVILGRVFCGWVCPMGTLNNMVGALQKKRSKRAPLNLHWLKYCILIFLITLSLFSLQFTGILDPISLLIRSFSLSVYPLIVYATKAAFTITILVTKKESVLKIPTIAFRFQPMPDQIAERKDSTGAPEDSAKAAQRRARSHPNPGEHRGLSHVRQHDSGSSIRIRNCRLFIFVQVSRTVLIRKFFMAKWKKGRGCRRCHVATASRTPPCSGEDKGGSNMPENNSLIHVSHIIKTYRHGQRRSPCFAGRLA